MPTRSATGWYPVADFDPRRLIQAQRLACLSRRDLAQAAGLDPLTIQSWAAFWQAPLYWDATSCATSGPRLNR